MITNFRINQGTLVQGCEGLVTITHFRLVMKPHWVHTPDSQKGRDTALTCGSGEFTSTCRF
jgi:hypothetical protein